MISFKSLLVLRLLTTAACGIAFASPAAQWESVMFAGTGTAGHSGDGGPAPQAQLDNPFGVVRGPDGAIYFCEYTGQVVRKVTKDRRISTVAGSGQKGYAGDGGPALQASFNAPHEIRFDRQGNLFIADAENHCVRRVDSKTQIVTTFAGTGKPGYSGDGGLATQAQFKQPISIQFGPDGSLYVCDIGNHAIRKVDLATGKISTFSGTGKASPTPDGAKIEGAPLNGPRSMDFDSAGNLWLATREGNQIFKFDLKAGLIHHVAGNGAKGFTGNGGPAKQATLSGPKGMSIAPNGNVYLADTENHSVRMIDVKKGTLELIAGTGEKGNGPDGDPLKCKLTRPHGIFVDADGSVFISDSENHRVRILRERR